MKKTKDYKYKLKENDVKAQVKDYLDIMGWYHFPLLQGIGSHPGLPDRIAIKNGRTIYIECKSPRGEQRPAQIVFEENIVRQKGEYLMIDVISLLMDKIG